MIDVGVENAKAFLVAHEADKFSKEMPQLMSEDIEITFKSGKANDDINDVIMSGQEYVDTIKQITSSFPDFHFETKDFSLKSSDDKSAVVTGTIVAVGTHTGEPFALGPHSAVPTKGIKCRNDPEVVEWTFSKTSDDKLQVKSFVVIPVEEGAKYTGPPGFYKQVGGVL